MIVLFIAGYIMIALEHVVNINKATFALMMCGILWAAYAVCGNDPNLSEDMVTALGDTCEIVVFLIGAMTIVELIDRYGGFNIIVHRIHAKNKRGLMWVLAFVAFFLSSILDNMTTTIIMVMMLRRMLSDQKRTMAVCLRDSACSQQRWSMVTHRRHNHHNVVDEKLCFLFRPYRKPHSPVIGIGCSAHPHRNTLCKGRTRRITKLQ